MYANGKGVDQNDATAMNWYRKAADKGNTQAQYNLGLMYGKGKGVPQNLSEALRWLRKAEANGSDQAAGAIQAVLQMQREQQAAGAPAPAPAPSPSAPPPIPITTTVHLCSLQVKPELNGQRGVVTGFDASNGRCSVQLEDGRGPYNIKPENLEVVTVEEKREKTKATKGKKKKKK